MFAKVIFAALRSSKRDVVQFANDVVIHFGHVKDRISFAFVFNDDLFLNALHFGIDS